MPENTSIKLYTWLAQPVKATPVHCWTRDDRRLLSGLTRHEHMGETAVLGNLTPPQLPLLLHFPGAAAQPQLHEWRHVYCVAALMR